MAERIRLEEFGKQLASLDRSLRLLAEEEDAEKRLSFRSAVVADFQLAFELCWKACQELAKFEETVVRKPKESVTFLKETGLIQSTDLFEAMIDSRNRSTHIYGQDMVDSMLPYIKEDFAQLLHEIHYALLRRYSEKRA